MESFLFCEQNEGELLYIPEQWMHSVQNVNITISHRDDDVLRLKNYTKTIGLQILKRNGPNEQIQFWKNYFSLIY